jgi:hypothetical protein
MRDIRGFLSVLDKAETGITERESADALWLAAHITGFQPGPGVPPPGRVVTTAGGAAGQTRLAAAAARWRRAQAMTDQAPLAHAASAASQSTPTGRGVPSLGDSPSARELYRPLALQRALRPLLRAVPTGPAISLDEEATVNRSAEAGAVIPVLIPACERWLNLVIVVDTSPSMMLWGNLVSELGRLLTQIGAFRTIRTWRFRFGRETVAISPLAAAGAPRAPREIIDPAGRQAFLVISDCVGEPWLSGAAMRAVETWARTGPLAIVQPLSQHLWSRSVPACNYLQLRSPYPGAPNDQLTVNTVDEFATDARDAAGGRAGVPIPILELSPPWLASWSQLISSTNLSPALATFTRARLPRMAEAARAVPDTDAQRIVTTFMAGASPEAFRLAGFLAAVPRSLPIHLMRRIQREMLPGTRPQHLAEIYLGGLMRFLPTADRGGKAGTPTFEFLDGVRDLLLRTVRRSEAIEVVELVSAKPGRHQATGGFEALPGIEPALTGPQLTGGDEADPDIEAKVLRRIGGRYAQVAATTANPLNAQAASQAVAPATSRVAPRQPPSGQPPAGPRGNQEGITLLGAPSSGKSTFLASLAIALLRQSASTPDFSGPWRVVGVDQAGSDALTRLTRTLTQDRLFPPATVGVERYHWELVGTISRTVRLRFFRRERRPEAVTIPLDLADTPGGAANQAMAGPARWESLIDNLEHSKGIVFLFDPVHEFTTGDAFAHTFEVVNELSRRMRNRRLAGGRLPHHVAVCITKFDEVRVFETAERLGLIEYDTRGPGFPRVPDDEAREFFSYLCQVSRSGDADLVMSLLEQTFRPERIKYFISSAIGFYVNPRTRGFDRDNFQNHVPGQGRAEPARIRGRVHPVNIVEPMLWLGEKLIE